MFVGSVSMDNSISAKVHMNSYFVPYKQNSISK